MGKKLKKTINSEVTNGLTEDLDLESEMIFGSESLTCDAEERTDYIFYLDENEEENAKALDDQDDLSQTMQLEEKETKTDTFTYNERKYLCKGCFLALRGAHERLFGNGLGNTPEGQISVYQSIDDFLHYSQIFELAHFSSENQLEIPIILHLIYKNAEGEDINLCDSTMNDVSDLIFKRVVILSMSSEERHRHLNDRNEPDYSNSGLKGQKKGFTASFYI